MAQFLRPAEAKLMAVMSTGNGDPVEGLVVRSTLPPIETRTALLSLQRRGLVVEVRTGWYALSTEGVSARNDVLPEREAARGHTPVFLLDDEIENTISSSSEDDLNKALDRELGARDSELED